MHRSVIPSQKELPGTERSVRLLPQADVDNPVENAIKFREPASQEDGEIYALRVIV